MARDMFVSKTIMGRDVTFDGFVYSGKRWVWLVYLLSFLSNRGHTNLVE